MIIGGRMTVPTSPDVVATGLIELATTQPTSALLHLLTPEGQQAAIVAAVAVLAQTTHNLEVRMSATDDKVTELSDKLDAVSGNVTNIVGDVQGLQAEVQRLQAELETQDPALAAKLQPLADKIQGLSDSTKTLADSVPDAAPVDPTPTPEEPAPVEPGDGGTDVVNPTPLDENGNPVV